MTREFCPRSSVRFLHQFHRRQHFIRRDALIDLSVLLQVLRRERRPRQRIRFLKFVRGEVSQFWEGRDFLRPQNPHNRLRAKKRDTFEYNQRRRKLTTTVPSCSSARVPAGNAPGQVGPYLPEFARGQRGGLPLPAPAEPVKSQSKMVESPPPDANTRPSGRNASEKIHPCGASIRRIS
jgi:hypothetical protein